MTIASMLQPDQDPRLRDRYVADYETIFEPLTDGFAVSALRAFGSSWRRRGEAVTMEGAATKHR